MQSFAILYRSYLVYIVDIGAKACFWERLSVILSIKVTSTSASLS